MVRTDLSKLLRKIVVALITTDVHNRDIIEKLYELGVESIKDFQWQQ